MKVFRRYRPRSADAFPVSAHTSEKRRAVDDIKKKRSKTKREGGQSHAIGRLKAPRFRLDTAVFSLPVRRATQPRLRQAPQCRHPSRTRAPLGSAAAGCIPRPGWSVDVAVYAGKTQWLLNTVRYKNKKTYDIERGANSTPVGATCTPTPRRKRNPQFE